MQDEFPAAKAQIEGLRRALQEQQRIMNVQHGVRLPDGLSSLLSGLPPFVRVAAWGWTVSHLVRWFCGAVVSLVLLGFFLWGAWPLVLAIAHSGAPAQTQSIPATDWSPTPAEVPTPTPSGPPVNAAAVASGVAPHRR
jgi:hypothetical protein